ncbi:precorrin-6Y C5,15-methyltransferase (decarboxylating) [Desulfocicer vacuolatum DSM 3385]|uniref:Precorrin-6Y C5,15-methyltransferase (Decarboxylating) n=1 Tax=Desulfocicer vacuolatum DSM 3385 TaxID=1121400 RepID=A0A1W2CBN2_9BACT|nr:precorrin-6y C5,15-methyltransferase (decarboxylating) subunit CbiE [Desulfocicer vacuolatum]SMC82496.1 precorrin-6Y C5,15-methyltransferase (decarboxylating) [Desulfocicer vacuolatum DSM 3385]
MSNVHVIGLGLSREDLTLKHLEIIKTADLLVGGQRHLDYFRENHVEKVVITRDIALVIQKIKERMDSQKVVVLASGDPLFYGIGATLVKALGREKVEIHPNISSPAAAFAAMGEPWQDARLISFHGRVSDDFEHLVKTENKIGILTDATHTPGWIAKFLLSRKITDFHCHVFERLGSGDAKSYIFDDLSLVDTHTFAMPNVVVLKRQKQEDSFCHGRKSTASMHRDGKDRAVSCEAVPPPVYPGMPDDQFFHENGLITKSEVRSVALSKLKLDAQDYTFWDLGAGSGSVSIEVSRFLSRGQLFAVEKNEKRIVLIERNKQKFCVPNLTVCHGSLPGAMDALPDPDRVFVGGGGKNIARIIHRAGDRLSMHGVMVINTVLVQTMYLAVEALKKMGFKTQFVQLQVAGSSPMPFGERLEALNPVWIITGEKQGL